MIIAKCPSCGKSYKIPKEKLPEGKKVSFSCPNCGGRIILDLRKPRQKGSNLVDSASPSSRDLGNGNEKQELVPASPDEIDLLRNRIERSIQNIPFMPQVVIKAQKAMTNPKTGGRQLATILQTDPAIVTSILKIANSAYYGLSGNVSSIEKACVILGQRTVKELIMTTGVSNLLGKKLKGYGYNSGELWMHSMAAGIASKMIAEKIDPELSEDAYLTGLLHDSGKIILDPYVLERKKAFDQFVGDGNHGNFEAEKFVLGFDHAEIAAKICKKWHIPDEITTAIKYHHHPSASGGHKLSYIVHTGDYVARLCGLGYEEDDLLYEAEKGSIEKLGLNREVLGKMMLEVLESIQQIGQSIKR